MDTTAKLTLLQLIKITSEAFLEEFKRKPIHAASQSSSHSNLYTTLITQKQRHIDTSRIFGPYVNPQVNQLFRSTELSPSKQAIVFGKNNKCLDTLTNFQIGQSVGKCSGLCADFGKIFVARHKKSNYICAIKIIEHKNIINARLKQQICREIRIHIHLSNHPNILSMYNYISSHQKLYFITDYAMGSNLYKALTKQVFQNISQGKGQGFNETQTVVWIQQLSNALQFIHNQNIMHRDLKPEILSLGINEITGKVDNLLISDFSWSVQSVTKRTTLCGTLDYLSPEMVNHQEYDHSIDLWSLGILTFELLVGKPPFEEQSQKDTCIRINNVDLQYPKHVSKKARRFMNSLLMKQSTKRMSLVDAMQHEWLQAEEKEETEQVAVLHVQNDKRHVCCGTRIVRFKNDPPFPKASIFCDEIKNDILHKTGTRFPGTFEEILASARKKQANRNKSKVSKKYLKSFQKHLHDVVQFQ